MSNATGSNSRCHTIYQEFAFGFGFERNRKIAAAFYGIYSPVIVFSNILLFTSFLFTKQIWLNNTNFLIVCLSISDAINGFLVLPLHVYFFFVFDELTPNYCTWAIALQSLLVIFYELSGLITFLITVDRYLHMNPNLERPSRVARLFDRPKVYILLALVFTLSCSHACIYAFAFNMKVEEPNFAAQGTVFIIIVVLSATIVLYVRGYRRIQRFTLDSPIYLADNGKPQYLKKLYKTVLVLLLLLSTAYTPVCLSNMTHIFQMLFLGNRSLESREFAMASLITMYVTCLFNSVVVLKLNAKAKQFILNIYRKRNARSVRIAFSDVRANNVENDATVKRSVENRDNSSKEN